MLSPSSGPHGTELDVGPFNLEPKLDHSQQARLIFGMGLDNPSPGPAYPIDRPKYDGSYRSNVEEPKHDDGAEARVCRHFNMSLHRQ